MTTVVCVWPPRGRQVGHAAVDVRGAAGAAYISWWPTEEGKAADGTLKSGNTKSILLGVRGTRFTFEQDKSGEGGFEPTKVALDGLDERAIIEWWRSFSERNWSLLNINCAQVAADALRAGGANNHVRGVNGWMSSWQATYWKPMEVLKFALAVQSGLRSK